MVRFVKSHVIGWFSHIQRMDRRESKKIVRMKTSGEPTERKTKNRMAE